MEGKRFPFTFVLNDPSGNSYISSESVGGNDNFLKRVNFMRTTDDFVAMGYNVDQAEMQRQEEQLRAAGKLPDKQDQTSTKAVK